MSAPQQMTPHEKECALAAIAARIEAAKKAGSRKELAEWRKFYREVTSAELRTIRNPVGG